MHMTGRLTQLEELHFDCNNLTSLPSSIGAIKNLKVLNLADNLLGGLPSELSELTELRILNCKNNKIGTIPDSIFRACTNLGKASNLLSLVLSQQKSSLSCSVSVTFLSHRPLITHCLTTPLLPLILLINVLYYLIDRTNTV